MKPKIIIADDSQTIQKVIKITLANEDFELIECLTDEALIEAVNSNDPALVLLDFNLSENKTGYDLSKEIKNSSNSKIMMLYGTFDTIDESLFQDAGINGHIVKPFDGAKFIGLCQQLISDSSLESENELEEFSDFDGDELVEIDTVDEELNTEPLVDNDMELEEFVEEGEELEFDNYNEVEDEKPDAVETKTDEVSIDEDWVVKQPQVIDQSEEEVPDEIVEPDSDLSAEEVVSKEELNTLEVSMQDWGIDIPAVIGEEKQTIELPPIIGDSDNKTFESIQKEPSEINKPAEELVVEELVVEELVVEELVAEELVVEEVIAEEFNADAFNEDVTGEINLLPADEELEYPDMGAIVEEVSKEAQFSTTTNEVSPEPKTISLNDTLGTNTDAEVKILEEQIADEVDNGEELWKSDEVVVAEEPVAVKVQEVKQEVAIQISEEEIQEKINAMITPMVEKIVREKIDSIIEKISWEVIPDLAENLIKKELKKITQEVTQSHEN